MVRKTKMRKILILLLLLNVFVLGYKPVLMLHGITGSYTQFKRWIQSINRLHPGQLAISLDVNNKEQSLKPLYTQVEDVKKEIIRLQKEYNFTEFHLVGHSQGALISRALLSMWDEHQVQNFISVAGPLMGVFGKFINVPIELVRQVYKLFYQRFMQDSLSVANMWNDPYVQHEYLKKNIFLPVINNQTFNEKSFQWKKNFLKTKNVILFGSERDDTILPWQSSLFGFWSENATKIIPMEEQEFYKKDYFGLKTLKEQNRLKLYHVPDVNHNDW